jgi:hypothetical protein
MVLVSVLLMAVVVLVVVLLLLLLLLLLFDGLVSLLAWLQHAHRR